MYLWLLFLVLLLTNSEQSATGHDETGEVGEDEQARHADEQPLRERTPSIMPFVRPDPRPAHTVDARRQKPV